MGFQDGRPVPKRSRGRPTPKARQTGCLPFPSSSGAFFIQGQGKQGLYHSLSPLWYLSVSTVVGHRGKCVCLDSRGANEVPTTPPHPGGEKGVTQIPRESCSPVFQSWV